jgi:hypothetical protein
MTIRFSCRIAHHCPQTPKILVGTKLDMRKDPQTLDKMRERKQQPIEYSQVRPAFEVDCVTKGAGSLILLRFGGFVQGVSMANQIQAAKVGYESGFGNGEKASDLVSLMSIPNSTSNALP